MEATMTKKPGRFSSLKPGDRVYIGRHTIEPATVVKVSPNGRSLTTSLGAFSSHNYCQLATPELDAKYEQQEARKKELAAQTLANVKLHEQMVARITKTLPSVGLQDLRAIYLSLLIDGIDDREPRSPELDAFLKEAQP